MLLDSSPISIAKSETPQTFARRLATTRKHVGLTRQALADRVGIHVTQLRRYEADTSQPGGTPLVGPSRVRVGFYLVVAA